jgi:hypothetical protein
MNRYETLIPRVAWGIAAVAMTAITIGVSVVMPAKMDSDSHEPRMLAALKVTAAGFRASSPARASTSSLYMRQGCPRPPAPRHIRIASQKAE